MTWANFITFNDSIARTKATQRQKFSLNLNVFSQVETSPLHELNNAKFHYVWDSNWQTSKIRYDEKSAL